MKLLKRFQNLWKLSNLEAPEVKKVIKSKKAQIIKKSNDVEEFLK